jgi:2-polyprenyl-3-methyl-5-hydroxy-6-metoxy-1,4-benzoquinol methylase
VRHRLLPSGRVILDVGSGWRHLIDWVVSNGYDATGVETDAWARERTLAPERVLDALPTSGDYDLITLFDVLEHIPEPLALVRLAPVIRDAAPVRPAAA